MRFVECSPGPRWKAWLSPSWAGWVSWTEADQAFTFTGTQLIVKVGAMKLTGGEVVPKSSGLPPWAVSKARVATAVDWWASIVFSRGLAFHFVDLFDS